MTAAYDRMHYVLTRQKMYEQHCLHKNAYCVCNFDKSVLYMIQDRLTTGKIQRECH